MSKVIWFCFDFAFLRSMNEQKNWHLSVCRLDQTEMKPKLTATCTHAFSDSQLKTVLTTEPETSVNFLTRLVSNDGHSRKATVSG